MLRSLLPSLAQSSLPLCVMCVVYRYSAVWHFMCDVEHFTIVVWAPDSLTEYESAETQYYARMKQTYKQLQNKSEKKDWFVHRDQVLGFGYLRIDCIWWLFFSIFSSLCLVIIASRKSIESKIVREVAGYSWNFLKISHPKLCEASRI